METGISQADERKQSSDARFSVRLARTEAELRAVQRLRYDVFVTELGGGGAQVDHAARLECDRFDAYGDHMILCDNFDAQVVGVYRLLRMDQAQSAGQFYCADEYDLAPLTGSGRRLLELGRSCLHPKVRGGAAMMYLWQGLSRYIAQHRVDVLFGAASFHGTDIGALAQPLSLLHHRHLAPEGLRVQAIGDAHQPMDLLPEASIDRRAAMVAVPPLIKAYLRLGGFVGQGAFVDHAFNTTDVCLVLDTARMNPRQVRLYQGGPAMEGKGGDA